MQHPGWILVVIGLVPGTEPVLPRRTEEAVPAGSGGEVGSNRHVHRSPPANQRGSCQVPNFWSEPKIFAAGARPSLDFSAMQAATTPLPLGANPRIGRAVDRGGILRRAGQNVRLPPGSPDDITI